MQHLVLQHVFSELGGQHGFVLNHAAIAGLQAGTEDGSKGLLRNQRLLEASAEDGLLRVIGDAGAEHGSAEDGKREVLLVPDRLQLAGAVVHDGHLHAGARLSL